MKSDLRALTLPLIALVAFNLLPQMALRPAWSSALCFVFLGYRAFLAYYQMPVPPRWVVWLAQVVIGVAIWQHYHSIFGDEAAGTLLTLLTCLKTYELRVKRDYFVNSMLCFLVLMSNMLLDQSLILTLYVVADVVVIMSFLYALESETFTWTGMRGYMRPVFMLTIKAVPILIVCFVLFPRFSTGFGTGAQTVGKTGITDELKPGSVSELINSEELVFRANFLSGDIPQRRNLYWRGAILDHSQGLNWSRDRAVDRQPLPMPMGSGGEIEIFLEPGFEKFLFSLEGTRAILFPNDFTRTRVSQRSGGIFELNAPLQNRERYVIESSTENEAMKVPGDLHRYLQTTDRPSPEMQKLLRSLKAKTSAQTVTNTLSHFRGDGYEYSMQPPAAKDIDEFMFKNKSGFCEHYAASTATMLRHMGVPARVIVGFQGGTPSFLENYISVRGQDAHAWVEYFDGESSRWRRIDPTAQVNPARLTLGSQSYLQNGGGWLPKWLVDSNSAYYRVRAVVDEFEASWIGFLVRFDLARQKDLLAKFGMEETLFRALPVFLLLALVLILAILYFVEAQRREKLSREERLYRDLLDTFKKWKIERHPADGPLTLMGKVRTAQPQVVDRVVPVMECLIEARFAGRQLNSAEFDALDKSIRKLRKISVAR